MKAVYEHYQAAERPFIDLILDWKSQVKRRQQPVLTHFLTPRQQIIAASIIGRDPDVGLNFFGGYEAAEAKRLYLYPPYWQVTEDDFQLSCFDVIYANQFHQLAHHQVLGSLLGLGLERNRLGDILLSKKACQFFVESELANYIQGAMTKMGRVSVKLEPISLEGVMRTPDDREAHDIIVSSLRLDTIVAEGFRLSRQKAKQAITQGYVKVNWQVQDSPSRTMAIGDLISVRGHGRLNIAEKKGISKKGNLILTILKMGHH